MTKLFGTDGIRGVANQYPMSPEAVLKIGQAIGVYFRERHNNARILIGKDTRRSGYMLEQALSAGICSVGVDVGLLGPLPTPGIAYLTRGLRACAGIVISASHNPFQDNGIKVFNSDGYKLPDRIEQELEDLVSKDSILEKAPLGMKIGRAKRIDDAIGQYAVFLKEQFPKHLSLEGLRLVVDCANGASYKVAPKVFQELGAEVFSLGVEPNGRNINDNCGALHPESLKEKVLLYKADLGLAFDGDADRLTVVDSRGKIVDGDQIMAICALKMLRDNRLKSGVLVATIMSNMGLDIAIEQAGGKVIRTQVGDRYVVEKMRDGDYTLGGEQSGHLIFRDSSTTGDGVLAGLKLLEILVDSGQSISELSMSMTPLPQVLKNFRVRKRVPIEGLPRLSNLISQIESSLGSRGRVVFRYSGTESLARVMIEGDDAKQITQYADDIIKLAEIELNSIEGNR